jgi:single-strand DNA-binding protein
MPQDSITLVGNVARDPELRFTSSGQPTATFGLAVNRRFQRNNEWVEEVSYFDIVCWRKLAENVAKSITKGSRVIVTGRLDQRRWKTPEGDNRSKVEVTADEIGAALSFATAAITKNERNDDGGRQVANSYDGGSQVPYSEDEEPF